MGDSSRGIYHSWDLSGNLSSGGFIIYQGNIMDDFTSIGAIINKQNFVKASSTCSSSQVLNNDDVLAGQNAVVGTFVSTIALPMRKPDTKN